MVTAMTIALGIVIFIIYLFFYEQTTGEYRINQVSYPLFSNQLLLEQSPIVITDIPDCPIWTIDDIRQRNIQLKNKPIIFTESAPNLKDSRYLGNTIGADVWLDKVLISSTLSKFLMKEIRATWGRRGLEPTHAWTLIIPTEDDATVSLVHRKLDKFLPYKWNGLHPEDITRGHTPFLSDIQYIDIIVRPGNALLVPPHWRMAFNPSDNNGLTLQVTFHHPMSLLMGAIRGH